jgi:hypothetical protein
LFRAISELFVLIRQLEHERGGFMIVIIERQRAHLGRAFPPVVGVVSKRHR